MHTKFINFFCDPLTKDPVKFYSFESDKENIISGLFVNPVSGSAYPVMEGVPVFLPDSLTEKFQNQFKETIQSVKKEIPNLVLQNRIENKSWSFSLEWEAHSKLDMNTTWGMTLQSRFEQFLLETQSTIAELPGKIMLDAGCGNGLLTEYFSTKGITIFGIDFSTSVFDAEKRRTSNNCCFLQGDLMFPPFRSETFDIIVSNGVLHHTPNTEVTFKSVAKTVKQNGKLYLWLYSRKGTLYWKFKRRIFDYLRMIICRMPSFLKKLSVQFIVFLLYYIYLLSGKKLDKNTLLIDIYDSVTPRWRYYHTPEEISRWFFEADFGPLSLTNWDTKYGFGSMAVKTPLPKTPGEHFTTG
ncbi:MAG TPA: methyltransferase domain-containing protein [Bacteroidia bacterium]|nr:methyltransferase domain-containing protein [Bacteroidia bacterium]